MPAEHLPVFALADDSIVDIQGEPVGLHKAVELIAAHLRKFLVDRSVVGVFEVQVSDMVSFVKRKRDVLCSLIHNYNMVYFYSDANVK